MGIILGALGGAGEALQKVGAANQDAQLKQDQTTLESNLAQQRAEALEVFKQQVQNAPLTRLQALAQNAAGEQVPVSSPPVTALSGALPADYGGPDAPSKGLVGDPKVLVAQIQQWPDGPDKTQALSQLQAQYGVDAASNAASVAGQTRPRTSEEALAAAVDDARLHDLPALAAYETQIGKPMRDEKRVAIQEDRADAIASHYAQMDAIRAQGEAGKNDRAAATNATRLEIAGDKQTAAGTLTPEMQITAKAIAEGRLPPLTGYAMRSPGASAIMAKVMEINPDYSGKDYGTSAKAEKDFATGKLGNTARSFNVALAHLDTLSGLSDALDNGNMQLVNKLGNAYATQTGGVAPVSFDAAKHLVADEIVKAVTGSAGALGDRESAAATVNSANSPAQLKSVIEVYKNLMGGQLDGLRMQYKSTTGKDDFDSKYLSPAAQSLGATAHAAGGPPVGFVKGGYRYMGGDPASQASWSPVQ